MVPRRAITTDNIPVEFDRRRLSRAGRARDRGADRRRGRLPPRSRGARTRARARRAAQGAQRPCRSLKTSAPSSPRSCRRRSTAAWHSSPASCAMPGRSTCWPAGAVEVHVDLASSLAARRTVELLRGRGAACEIRTYREHRFERATRFLIVVGGRCALAAGAPRGRRARPQPGAHRARAGAHRLARLLPSRVPARRVHRLRLALAAAQRGAPRVARLERRGRIAAAGAGRGRGLHPRRARDAALLARRTPRAARRSAACWRRSARTAPSCGSRRRACSRGRARRPTASPTPTRATCDGRPRPPARHTDAIEQVGGPDALPPELRTVAELRLRLPEATLAELGDAAMPRLTKSAVASRLRRIVQRADL